MLRRRKQKEQYKGNEAAVTEEEILGSRMIDALNGEINK
jgi:hypothetical protein